MRPLVLFVSSRLCRTGASGSDISFSRLLSRGHGRLSKSPAPRRHGALLLPLRGPPGFRFPPKKIGSAGRHLFRFLRENAELGLGSRCHLPSGAPRESRAEKEIHIMYQNRISLIGFVGNDVQLKSTKNGTSVAVLSFFTSRSAVAFAIPASSYVAARTSR